MNVVIISYVGEQRYACKVPDGVKLHKGMVVEIQRPHRRPCKATCVTDSEDVPIEVVKMLNNGKENVNRVVISWDEDEDMECGMESISSLL